MKKNLILASKSLRRRQILNTLGLKYKCISPDILEKSNNKKLAYIVKDIAYKKAVYVSNKINKAVILSADTIVVCRGEIIGKPKSLKHAVKILRKLVNNSHYVYTGIAIIDKYSAKTYKDYEKTKVKMKHISDTEIKKLVKNHMDKAGAYAIQEDQDKLVENIKGDY